MAINTTLEEDDLVLGTPIVHPLPVIEFRLFVRVQAHRSFRCIEPQHEPHLLLSNAYRLAIASDKSTREVVFEPLRRATEDIDAVFCQSELFIEFPKKRVFGTFVRVDPALRKLPSILPDTTRPQHLPLRVRDDDAYVGAISVGVDHNENFRLTCPLFFHALTTPANCSVR